MTKEEIFKKLQDIFQDIFDDKKLEIQESTNSDDIENWDSLNHINLVIAIENEFGIKFSFDELATLNNVGAMVNLMMKKL